jgi:hypothetical protein
MKLYSILFKGKKIKFSISSAFELFENNKLKKELEAK